MFPVEKEIQGGVVQQLPDLSGVFAERVGMRVRSALWVETGLTVLERAGCCWRGGCWSDECGYGGAGEAVRRLLLY